jgi:inner membrane protein
VASFGHLAVGLLAGRLHDEGRTPNARPRNRTTTLIGFGLLGMLPDADVLGVALGIGENSVAGHRGVSHSLLTAVALAIAGALVARRYGWSGLRTALAVTLAIGSHGVLDAFGQGGRAIPLFWPLSEHRFIAPWRCLPDAPRGMQFISRHGLCGAALEFLYFLPITAYALWPRPAARAPRLAVLDGGLDGGAAEAALRLPAGPMTTTTVTATAAGVRDDDDRDDRDEPSLRSMG